LAGEEASMKKILTAALVIVGMAAGLPAQDVVDPGPGVTLPKVIREVHPDYTPEAQAQRIQGTVLLAAVVLANGAVDTVTVDRSLDKMYGLDQQAVNALKQWTFRAGTKDGKSVAVRIHVEMTFRLK
jgi:periplasmic protein TonB